MTTEPAPPPTRPTSLNQIIGQDRAVNALRTAMQSERIHHAWIFSGPNGVGKRTTAEAFAAALLDPTTAPTLTGELEPDPDSETQRLLAAGSHPDMHIITKELAVYSDDPVVRASKQRNIPLDVIRSHLIKAVQHAASVGTDSLASKFFIIDEAELMQPPAQNAILKSLEEPPPGSVIVLITSSEDRLLPTVRSRCQRIVFPTLDEDAMQRWFRTSDHALSSDQLAWTMHFAAGSPGRAALAIDTELYNWATALNADLADLDRGGFSPTMGATMAKLVNDWAAAWVDGHKNASKQAANHAAAAHMFTLLAQHLDVQLRRAANTNDEAALQRTLQRIDLIHDAERHIAGNVQLGFAFENLVMQMSRA